VSIVKDNYDTTDMPTNASRSGIDPLSDSDPGDDRDAMQRGHRAGLRKLCI
jgi:hypothetical protein